MNTTGQQSHQIISNGKNRFDKVYQEMLIIVFFSHILVGEKEIKKKGRIEPCAHITSVLNRYEHYLVRIKKREFSSEETMCFRELDESSLGE